MGFIKDINIYKDFGIIFSFQTYYPLLDIKYDYHYGKLWNIRFFILKFEIDFYFQGSDLPF